MTGNVYVEIIRPGNHRTDKNAWARIDAPFLSREDAQAWADLVLAPGLFCRFRADGKTLATHYVAGAAG